MHSTIIALEMFALLVVLTISYASIFEIKTKSLKNKIFSQATLIAAIALISDIIVWICNGKAQFSSIIWFCVLLDFSLGYLLSVFVTYYVTIYISERIRISKWPVKLMITAFIISLVLEIVFSINKGYFYIDNGFYTTGPRYPLSQLFTVFSLIFNAVFILRYRKVLGFHDTAAMLSYIVVPIFSVLINIFSPGHSYSFVAIAFSILMVYILLQVEQEQAYRAREAELSVESTTDILTGLLNRRAYNMACKHIISGRRTNVGVVFSDLNGLKYTNDNYGHEAGDLILRNFAGLLLEYFRKSETFRISGDEFVVLQSGISKENFCSRVQEFINSVSCGREGAIAAVGASFGESSDLLLLLKNAEDKMYSDKEIFYQKSKKIKRRTN